MIFKIGTEQRKAVGTSSTKFKAKRGDLKGQVSVPSEGFLAFGLVGGRALINEYIQRLLISS